MLIKVKARSRISFKKLVKWLHGNTCLKHFHAVKAAVYVNDQSHVNTDRSTPKAGAFMSSLGELTSHRVPDMPPAR
jgi:hypothetical protein